MWIIRIVVSVWIFIVGFHGACRAAEAQEQVYAPAQAQSPFLLNPLVDTALIVASSALWLITPALADELPYSECRPCDRDSINDFDRLTVDRYSPGSDNASDVLAAVLPLSAVGLSLLNLKAPRGAREFGIDIALLLETLAVNGMLHRLTTLAAGRARPYVYQDDPEKLTDSIRDYTSFYSGHTSTAFALAASMSYLYSKRHPKSRWRFVVWAASMTAAGTMGALRVLAGKHFPTDVIAGSVIGSGIGLLVPALHLRKGAVTPSLAVGPTGMSLALRF